MVLPVSVSTDKLNRKAFEKFLMNYVSLHDSIIL